MKRVKIICNPSSGRQGIVRKVDQLALLLLGEGYTVGRFNTEKKNDAMWETIRTCDEDWDFIIGCGGDGTINEIANGIARSKRILPVAILSTGTVNDFGSYMGLPINIKEFYDMIRQGKIIDVDLGKVNDNYFVNVAACGLMANVGYQVEPEMKAIFGRMAYYMEGIREIPKQLFQPINMKIESDEYSAEKEVLLFLVANSSSIGSFKKLAPEASVQDGLLDIVIIRKSEVYDIAQIFFKIFTGDHVNHSNVSYFKSKRIAVDTDEEIKIDIDGEYGGKLPAIFTVEPKKFKIFTV